jgi:RNA polymerase sigma-70 factor (ECF subfamily)
VGAEGELVLLEEQDRARWDADRIAEGWRMLERAARHRRPGPYQLQAAIAGAHVQEAPDWSLVASLYGRLACVAPSPVVELNRAVAVAMDEGPERGLELLERIEGLERYHLLHAARADLLRRLERNREAADAYRQALDLAESPPERDFLARRLAEVGEP